MTKKDSFDLFPTLTKLGKNRDYTWFTEGLSETGKKTVQPFVLARWLTGCRDADQIIRIDEMMNPYLFSSHVDKELLVRMLAKACTGSTSRYQWIKAPTPKGSNSLAVKALASYYECSLREAHSFLSTSKPDTILAMAEELGWDKDEITKLTKELNDGSGSPKKTSSTKAKPRK